MKRILSYVIVLLFVFQGCDEQGNSLTNVTPEEEAEANLIVDSANSLLFEVLSGDSESDMDTVDDLYDDALVIDSNNKGAHFGKAFMQFALISQNEDLFNSFKDWEDCGILGNSGLLMKENEGFNDSSHLNLYNNDIFEHPYAISESLSSNILHFLNYLPIITSHQQILNRNIVDCPNISDIQDLLETAFLNPISSSIAHFENVVNSGFVFDMTGDMMGDSNQESSTLADGEIYLMKAFMHMVRGVIYAIITYDIDVPYELGDESITLALAAQDSKFLTIRPGQENSWPNAHDDLNKVIDSIESALMFLSDAGGDSQNDAMEEIDIARILLNEDINMLCENEAVACPMSLSLSNFLNNPPHNMKNILPDYNVVNCPVPDEGCFEIDFTASSCTDWYDGLDVTIGGLLPYMTKDVFINDVGSCPYFDE